MSYQLPHSHGEKNIEGLKTELAREQRFFATSETFKLLSDTTRLQIFWLLCHEEECVINIAALVGMSSPAVSHHLRALNDSGLISCRRDGKEVYYKAAESEKCRVLHKAVEQVMEIACPEQANGDSYEQIICDVHEYLLEHIADRITIEDLSKKYLMNPTTLKKEFKRVYGTSLAAHTKQHRMEKAAQLLRQSRLSISEIARAVGYESQSRFTQAFLSIYGELPSLYRKK